MQILLVSDFGPRITIKIVESLREDILAGKLKSGSEIKVYNMDNYLIIRASFLNCCMHLDYAFVGCFEEECT